MNKRLLVVLVFLLGVTSGAVVARTSGLFADTPSGHYAGDAIRWVVENTLFGRCGPDKFCPDEPVTRAEMVTFLHRFAQQTVEDPLAVADPGGPDPVTTTTKVVNGKTFYTPVATLDPKLYGLQKLALIRRVPENCDGYLPKGASFEEPPLFPFWGTEVGYLTHQAPVIAVNFLVDPYEAWCSGVRDMSFSWDIHNLWPIEGSVGRAKAAHDPLEWWNTEGDKSPRNRHYPGWCQYLYKHVEVKLHWGATMDQAEYDFVEEQLSQCGRIVN